MQNIDGLNYIHILSLGDSYTIGTGVEEGERWYNLLARALMDYGFNVSPVISIAQNGWTSGDLINGITHISNQRTFDLVTLLIGVNNQYQGLDVADYIQDFRLLLIKAIEYAGASPGNVIVLSIPDWGVTPFAAGLDRRKIAREIDEFNRENQRLSKDAGVNYVDITPHSRQAGKLPSNLASDGLHPCGKMYAVWVKRVLPIALRSLHAKIKRKD